MQTYPILRDFDAESPFILNRDGRVSASRFLGQARALSETLPERPVLINYCDDRYHFMLAFVAALLRGQVMVLPPDRSEVTLGKLIRTHPDCYLISDSAVETNRDLEQLALDDRAIAAAVVDESFAIPDIPAAQQAAILYTSGSSGEPKANAKSWGSLVRGAWQVGQRFGIQKGWNLLATVPSQHMFGFETTVLLPMQHGLGLVNATPLFPYEIESGLARLCNNNPVLITTPLQLKACNQDESDLSCLRFALSSTAPLARQLADHISSRNQIEVHEIYGSTETGAIATRVTARESLWQPLGSVSFEQRDGRWSVSGGHLDTTQELSDQLEFEGERFNLLGRDSDLIKVAGKRASLMDLNRRVVAIEGVDDAVFFMPESGPNQTVRPVLVAVSASLDARQLHHQLGAVIDKAFLPRSIIFVERLPRTQVGKLQRQQLESIYRDHQAAKKQRQ